MTWHLGMDAGLLTIMIALGVAVGHASLTLTGICRLHAIGISHRWASLMELPPLVIPALMAIGLAWLLVTTSFLEWPVHAQNYGVICLVVGWVVVPVVTIRRWLRRLPDGVSLKVAPVPLGRPESEFIGESHRTWMLRLPGNESLSLQRSDWNIVHPALPDRFGSLRILHITDLHFARCYTRDYFDALIDSVVDWDADLVVFTGDLLDDETTLDWTGPVLGRLRGRLGQYAILGNHDTDYRPGRVRGALRRAGFVVVDGRWITIEDGERSIAMGGTSAPWGPWLDAETKPEADVSIVLSHSPDQFPRIARWGTVDLVLAGHNHGGQIRFPIIGPLVMPSLYGRHFDRGLFQQGSTMMVLSQGIGGKHPIRYGCRPEVGRVVLQSLPAPARIGSMRVSRMSDSTSRT